MIAHILIIVSIAVMPIAQHEGIASSTHRRVGATWSAVTMQRFEDRAACEHAAKQIRSMQGWSHDLRMTCQPAQIEKAKP